MQKAKLGHILGVCGLALGALGAVVTPAITNQNSHYTVSATGTTSVPDTTTERQIVIHKYSMTPDQKAKQDTDTGKLTGSESDKDLIDPDVLDQPLANIKFDVTRVSAVAGKKVSVDDPTSYTVDTSYTGTGGTDDATFDKGKTTVTTNADGEATANLGAGRDADGYYLVHEESSDAVATAAADFIVYVPMATSSDSTSGSTDGLNYAINVFPKNDTSNSTDTNPIKTIEENGKEEKETSIVPGNDATWDLTIDRPNDIQAPGTSTEVAKTLTITHEDGSTTTIKVAKDTVTASKLNLVDKLASALQYKSVDSVTVQPADTTTSAIVLDGDDYTVDAATKANDNTVTISLTDSGLEKFAAAGKGATLTAKLVTTVLPNGDSGSITNSFTTNYTGTTTPGKTITTTTTPGTEPKDETGNVDVLKVAQGDTTKTLAHAVFAIYDTKEAADAGDPTAAVQHAKVDADGNLVKDSSGKVEMEPYTVTTGDDGKADFRGLKVGDNGIQTYYVREIDAPVGYDIDNTVYKVTAADDTTGTDDTGKSTSDANDVTVEDKDNMLPNLPLTGSQGRLLFYALTTGLIVIGAAGVYFIKRRKNA